MRKIIITFISAVCISNSAFAQSVVSIDRASQTSSGEGGNADVGAPAISPNSDRIVFASFASNLVSNDENSRADIFLKNLATNEITRLTNAGIIDPNTGLVIESNGHSAAPTISTSSANGFFGVAFQSAADNIGRKKVAFPDNNNKSDIYLSVPKRAFFLERVSVGPNATEPNGDSMQASVAAVPLTRQFFVTYTSEATNLVEGDINGRDDIFLSKVTLPKGDVFNTAQHVTTERVGSGLDGSNPDARSLNPVISADGQFIVFESFATNMTSAPASNRKQIYLYNVATKAVTLISKDSAGNPGNELSQVPTISFNGKFVVYASRATNIVNDGYVPEGDYLQIFMFDVSTGQTVRVNTSASGVPGNGESGNNVQAVVSPDGRFVLFSDTASNLIADDTNGVSDIFIKDLATANVVRVNRAPGGGEANAGSLLPTFAKSSFNSTTGRASYASAADNLISNDTEDRNDIFASTITIPALPLSKTTRLEVPADLTLDANNKKAVVVLQAFSGVQAAQLRALFETEAAKSSAKKVRYQIKLTQLDVPKKKRDERTILSKRNTLTIKSLKPGNYSMKYQAQTVKNDKVIQKTPYSPTVFFNTLDE